MQKSLSLYIDSRVEVQWIEEISGRGIFAKEDIPAGALIERAKLILIPKSLINIGIWFLQAEGLPDDAFQLDQYAIDWNADSVAVPLGWAGIYNHSDSNNSKFCYWSDEDPTVVGVMTLTEIAKGQQITVSYGKDWFDRKPYVQKVSF